MSFSRLRVCIRLVLVIPATGISRVIIPTPGGNRVVNKAFVNYMQGINSRASRQRTYIVSFSFLLLAQKKRNKEKGSHRSFSGEPFFQLHTHYNSPDGGTKSVTMNISVLVRIRQ